MEPRLSTLSIQKSDSFMTQGSSLTHNQEWASICKLNLLLSSFFSIYSLSASSSIILSSLPPHSPSFPPLHDQHHHLQILPLCIFNYFFLFDSSLVSLDGVPNKNFLTGLTGMMVISLCFSLSSQFASVLHFNFCVVAIHSSRLGFKKCFVPFYFFTLRFLLSALFVLLFIRLEFDDSVFWEIGLQATGGFAGIPSLSSFFFQRWNGKLLL